MKTLYIGNTAVLKIEDNSAIKENKIRLSYSRTHSNLKVVVAAVGIEYLEAINQFPEDHITHVEPLNSFKDYFLELVFYTVVYQENQILKISGQTTPLLEHNVYKGRGKKLPVTTYYRNGSVYKEIFLYPRLDNRKTAWNIDYWLYFGSYPTYLYYKEDGTIDENRSIFHLLNDRSNPLLNTFLEKSNISCLSCLDCDVKGYCQHHISHTNEMKFYSDYLFVTYAKLKAFLADYYNLDEWKEFKFEQRKVISIILNPHKHRELLFTIGVSDNKDKLTLSREQLNMLEILVFDLSIIENYKP